MDAMRQRGVVMDSPEIEYPESDGQPMAETDLHRNEMADLIAMLGARYRDAADVYVSGNLFVYYREGDPGAVVAPDVFVVLGATKGLRRTYKVWVEGLVPTVALEATSRKTRREDLRDKKATYARLGVAEYWLYDPYGEYLRPSLQGFRLVGGEYIALTPDEAGALASAALGVRLHLEGGLLVLTDAATNERLARPHEVAERAEAARRGAELARRQAVTERRRADAAQANALSERERAVKAEAVSQSERCRGDAEQQRADVAEAELAALRAELWRLRGQRPAG